MADTPFDWRPYVSFDTNMPDNYRQAIETWLNNHAHTPEGQAFLHQGIANAEAGHIHFATLNSTQVPQGHPTDSGYVDRFEGEGTFINLNPETLSGESYFTYAGIDGTVPYTSEDMLYLYETRKSIVSAPATIEAARNYGIPDDRIEALQEELYRLEDQLEAIENHTGLSSILLGTEAMPAQRYFDHEWAHIAYPDPPFSHTVELSDGHTILYGTDLPDEEIARAQAKFDALSPQEQAEVTEELGYQSSLQRESHIIAYTNDITCRGDSQLPDRFMHFSDPDAIESDLTEEDNFVIEKDPATDTQNTPSSILDSLPETQRKMVEELKTGSPPLAAECCDGTEGPGTFEINLDTAVDTPTL